MNGEDTDGDLDDPTKKRIEEGQAEAGNGDEDESVDGPENESSDASEAEEEELMTYDDVQDCMSELYAIATDLLKNEKDCHSRPSDLIQSFLVRYKVSDQDWSEVTWNNRAHFFNCAYLMMRRGLVRRARKRNAQRNPPIEYRDPATVPLIADFPDMTPDQVIDLDEALAWLAEKDSELALIIQHHYFGRLTYEKVADLLETSRKTVQRKLSLGRALLKKKLFGNDGD